MANVEGTLTGSTAGGIQVLCTPLRYKIAGTVANLAGSITLAAGGQSTTVTGTGTTPFAIGAALTYGQPYALSVQGQPTGQTCTVGANSTGTTSGDVTNAAVSCISGQYPLVVKVSGLHGNGQLVVQNNSANDKTVTGSGTGSDSGSFGNILHNVAYNVSIKTQPSYQTCTIVGNHSGNATAAVDVQIDCTTHTGDANYTSGNGTWTVPPGVYQISIEVAAGGGGGSNGDVSRGGATGGKGAKVTVTNYAVTPGQVFSYRIGNGGGNGGQAGGGGGSTGVYLQNQEPAPLVIAGGGQGGGSIYGLACGSSICWYSTPGQGGNCTAFTGTYAGTLAGGKGSGGAAGGGGVNGTYTTSPSSVGNGGGGGGAGPAAAIKAGTSLYPAGAVCTSDGGTSGTAGNAAYGNGTAGGAGWVTFHAPLTLATQTLTCGTASKTYGDPDFAPPSASVAPGTTGGPTGALSYGGAGGACSDAVGGQLHINGAGSCTYNVTAAGTPGVLAPATQACAVAIAKQTTSLALAYTPAALAVGGTATASVTPTPALATGETLSFSTTSAATICTVQASSGLVTGVGAGSCAVTAQRSGTADLAGSTSTTSVAVALPVYTLSGSVSGLVGGQSATVSNGTTSYTVANGAPFSFSATQGSAYAITATAAHHICTPASVAGTASASLNTIAFTCTPIKYSVGGTLTGLPAGTSATVTLGTASTTTTSGSFQFASSVAYASPYSVAASATGYSCTSASGTVSGDVANASISCTALTYDLDYSVSGLGSGKSVVLSLDGVEQTRSANGAAQYTKALTHGKAFALTVKTQPTGQSCTVSANGTGASASAPVTGVTVLCTTHTYLVTGAAQPAIGGSVACPTQAVAHGDPATCTATATAGWRFKAFDAASACTRTSGSGGTTCEIDDLQAIRTVTAQFEPYFAGTTVPASGTGGPASATFTGGGDTCRFVTTGGATAFEAPPAALPAGQALPQGMFRFKLVGCTPGAQVRMQVTWPQPVTAYLKYGKASPTAQASYYSLTAAHQLFLSGNTASFTVQDGALGDDDWTQNGEIMDPTGPLQASAQPGDGTSHPIPTLGDWGLLLLSALVALLGGRKLRLKMGRSAC